MMRHVAVLGATGQIGASTLEVVRCHPDRFRASVLVAHRNVEALTGLCALHRPDLAIIADLTLEADLARRLTAAGVRCDVASGHAAIAQASASSLCDTVVAAIPGTLGLDSSLTALLANKRLVLTNKVPTVLAGPLLLQALIEGSGELICVDAELNAVPWRTPEHRPGRLAAANPYRLGRSISRSPPCRPHGDYPGTNLQTAERQH